MRTDQPLNEQKNQKLKNKNIKEQYFPHNLLFFNHFSLIYIIVLLLMYSNYLYFSDIINSVFTILCFLYVCTIKLQLNLSQYQFKHNLINI